MPHIVATVTSHGLGHLSISAPVLNKLHLEVQDLKLTLISGLAETRLHARISAPFNYVARQNYAKVRSSKMLLNSLISAVRLHILCNQPA